MTNDIFYTNYGLYTIGGRSSRFCVSFAGKAVRGWDKFYGNDVPWKKWFTNPIFHNRTGYDPILERYRVWFIFMWFIFRW